MRQTVTQAVATPIEQELNGTPGMIYMESSIDQLRRLHRHGHLRHFDADPDLAAVEVQNRAEAGRERACLPRWCRTASRSRSRRPSKLLTITLLSSDPKFDEIYLA